MDDNNENSSNRFAPPRALVADPAPSDSLVLAEPGTRLLAFLIDYAPAIVVGVIGGIAAAAAMPSLLGRHRGTGNPFDDMGAGFAVVIGILFIAFLAWGIYNIVLVYRYGQTWGKKMMGIRMVRKDGSRMSFARFFWLRGVVYGLCAAIPFVGWIVRLVDKLMIFREGHQCFHDVIADTIVVTADSSQHATLAGSRQY
jgi:uncharacterized RDD family membrane protein YckC